MNCFEWNEQGLDALGKKDYKKASECFKKSLEVNEDYLIAWSNIGTTYLKLMQFENALECYDKRLESDPMDTNTLNQKGLTLKKLEKIDFAIDVFDEIISIDPFDTAPWINKGIIFESQNNLEKCTYRSPVTKAVMIKDGLARKIEMIDVGAKVSNWKRDHHPAGIIYDDEMAADCTYNPHRYRDWFCKGTNGKNYTLPNNNNKVTEGELITLAVKTIDCLKGKGSNVKIDSNEDITSCIQTPKGKLPRHNPLIPSDPGFRRGQGHFYKKMDYGFCYDARVHCRFSK